MSRKRKVVEEDALTIEKSEFESQQEAIEQACDELKDFLLDKNESYQGSAFKEVTYNGRTMYPEDTIDSRIVDKIRRLQSDSADFEGEDSELDLCGYIVLKRALKILDE
jgi:hypothetical protein